MPRNTTPANNPTGLPPAGHARREMLRRRADTLNEAAETLLSNTDTATYSVDPEKLKEEPEILKHFDVVSQTFAVDNPKPGYVYFWERDDANAIARKKAEARVWLGPGFPSWEVVSGEHEPEAHDLLAADGTRRIGDVRLMRIPLESYVRIQKRILLMTRFREANIPQKLADFVAANEGRVSVIQGAADPRTLYAREVGGTLVHTAHSLHGDGAFSE